jgi:hypothetical protein
MKNYFLLLFAVLFCANSFAKVWRINNIPGITADFTTAQAAHDNLSVFAGDTLHLEPSTTGYGNLTMTKKLTIISVGDFLGTNPGVQYSQITGTLGSVTINNVNASGSVFHCSMSGNLSVQNTTSCRIERCNINGQLYLNSTSNTTVLQNYLNYVIVANSNNTIISNNIISYYLQVQSTASATVTNNVIFAESAVSNQPMFNSSFQNNILNKLGSFTFTNSIVENNLAANASLPAGNGNQTNVNMVNVFVNSSGNTDAAFKLQTTIANPAQGAGVNGVDCGAYGGTAAFKPGLQPAIPAIYKLNAPATPAGNTMNITFSTRSNN